MRKIVSLITCVLLATGLFAGEYDVAVSNYYTTQMGRTLAFHLMNETGERDYVFPISLPEGATDIEYGKTYEIEDMNTAYTFWWYPATMKLGALYSEAEFTIIKDANGKVYIDAKALDMNDDIWYLIYDEREEPDMPQGGTIVADIVSSGIAEGVAEYVLQTEDNTWAFFFDIKLAEGQSDVVSGVTYTMSDMYPYPQSAGYYRIRTEIKYQTVSFVKTVAGDGSYTIAVTVVDENGYTWHLSGSQAAPPDPTEQHLDYDTEDKDYNQTFNSYTLDLSTLSAGYAILTAYDYVNKFMVYIQFWTPTGYEIFGAATYPIDYTQGDFTVNASSGVDAESGGMTPSFVATLVKESGEYKPYELWLLVTGTVTVREDGVIFIEGQNSYGRMIKATLYPEDYVTALEDVQTNDFKVQKVLQNGQILIIQPNRKFSIMGSPTY